MFDARIKLWESAPNSPKTIVKSDARYEIIPILVKNGEESKVFLIKRI